jgi:hypothetical protein
MKLYQLAMTGEDCIGARSTIRSRQVFTSKQAAERYASEFRAIVQKREDESGQPYLVYLTQIDRCDIIELELLIEEGSC